jgi:hypothetical protein
MAYSLPEMFRTEQEAKEAAVQSRLREVESGYRPTDYIILKITVSTTYSDGDEFISDMTRRERVE